MKINDDYLNRLKDDDYIAWDSLVNDPMVKGQSDGNGCVLPIVILIIVIGLAIWC